MKSVRLWIPITGFVLLTAMTGGLLLSATIEAWNTHLATGIIAMLVLIGAFTTMIYQGISLRKLGPSPIKAHKHLFNFLAVFLGGMITFYFSVDIGLGAVVASGLIGLFTDMIFPDLGAPAFCGSFVGMSSDGLFFSYSDVVLASAIAGLVYVLTSKVFNGFGGKLGTIAFIGTAGAGLGLGRQFLFAPIADGELGILIMLIAFIAAPLTFFLNCRLKNGPVLASSAVGLLAGLTLPFFFPVHGSTLAVVAFCASFTGMTSQNRCPAFWQMLVAGVFTGVLFIFATPLLPGAGGKLGTIGFASIISVWGYIHLYQDFYGRNSQFQTDQGRSG